MNTFLRHFWFDLVISIIGLVVAYSYDGWTGVIRVAILVVLEIVFSFDNAAVNAKYLARLSHFWRRIFLTVGILIAVFGMRLLFPFVIVCLAGHVSMGEAWTLAMQKGNPEVPGTYGYILNQAHPTIAAFGSMFLLMLFLDFLLDSERENTWLSFIEKPLQKLGGKTQIANGMNAAAVVGSLLALAIVNFTLVDAAHHKTVLESGVLGVVVYLAVNGLAGFMERQQESKEEGIEAQEASMGHSLLLTGKAAFSTFLFLEVLDASFSFDGVLGAFAITQDPIEIAIGLGIGALAVRSITIFLVDEGTLTEYDYLEHGAHWAIGTLAVMLLLTLRFDIPDAVIGLCGIVFITASVITSIREKKHSDHDDNHNEPAPGIYSSHPDHAHGHKALSDNA